MKNTYTNPDIDFTEQFPTSQNSRHIYLAEQRKKMEAKSKKLSEEYGLFFFFKNESRLSRSF